MIPYVIIGAFLSGPLLLGLLFRVSTSHLFFSLMAGELIAHYFGEEVENIIESIFKSGAATEYTSIVVLAIPMLLTALFLHGSLSKNRIILHFIPLLVTGLVFAAFALPLLPESVQTTIRTVEIGQELADASNIIIAGVVTLQLVALWLLNRPSSGKGHKKH